MNIRPYNERDLADVIALFRSNIPKYFVPDEETGLREFLSESGDGYYVAELDSSVVGAGGFALNDDGGSKTISLCWGMIRADRLGTGLGKRLTEFRIKAARERFGALPIVISTSQHTRGFYERFGFRMTRHVADHFAPGIDLCEMRLDKP
ncbi:MAG: GNAT family N-acetyltransferase [Pyrinomonadaceae bacterium]